jgi:hypothetical protein
MYLAFECNCVFRVGTGDRLCHVDPIAGLHHGDAGADCLDDPGTIGPGRVGQWWLDGVRAVRRTQARSVRVLSPQRFQPRFDIYSALNAKIDSASDKP